MATNLTPQYHKAETQHRRAASTEEQLKWLEVMLQEIPKHKASEKLQADLKQRISRARKELEAERQAEKKAQAGIRIPRQGAGTAVILGAPNAGKSQLLASLTRATPEVAAYPFTTRTPLPGMMSWEDVMVQLIDTPPITPDYLEPYLQGMIRAADLALLVVDVGSDEGLDSGAQLLDKLRSTRTRLASSSYLDDADIGVSYTRALLVANKIDQPDAVHRLELLPEVCRLGIHVHPVSAAQGLGLDALKRAIFEGLEVIRVYTKAPTAKEADFERPFTLPRGSTVIEVAALVHQDLADHFKHARVWNAAGDGSFLAKADYVLQDRDIVEIHR